MNTIVVSKIRLINLQMAVYELSSQFVIGEKIYVDKLNQKIKALVYAFSQLNPNTYVSEDLDNYTVDRFKMSKLQESLIKLANYFAKGRMIDPNIATTLSICVINNWIDLGKNS